MVDKYNTVALIAVKGESERVKKKIFENLQIQIF